MTRGRDDRTHHRGSRTERRRLMRITGLRATPVAVPFREDELWAYGGRRGLVSILLEVTTDEGITGIGEAAAYPSADIVLAVLRSVEPLVVGEDPFAIQRISQPVHGIRN